MLRNFLIKKKWCLIFAAGLIAIFLFLVVYTINLLGRKTFYDGISVEGIDISGLSIIQAKELIDKRIEYKYRDKKIKLYNSQDLWTIQFNDISLIFHTEKALSQAYGIGRKGNIFNRIYRIFDIKTNKVDIGLECTYDREKTENILQAIKKQVDIKGKNASIKVNGRQLSFEKETIGKSLDIKKTLLLLDDSIKGKRFDDIALPINNEVPEITYDGIKDINSFISSFSTAFNANNNNRTYNIKLACERINGKLVLPGKVFSMDTELGPRSIENGYKEAPVIFNKELIEGIGGGVCQVTTTLYVAVLKAGLDILERSPHSLPLGYVEPGQDATIAENTIDFKFKNNSSYPICIGAEVKGNRAIISIIGKEDSEAMTIELKSEVLETYMPEEPEYIPDDNVPAGKEIVIQEERKGYRVAVYREFYSSSGELVKREKVSEDVYRPVRGRIKVNESLLKKEKGEEIFSYHYFYYPIQ
ncbi:MAG: VanW family protein [Acetivibrionales bacterium]|jgi:vancomycin resistance protein YoaR